MKKIISVFIIATIMSGCYGSFTLTKKLYNWNTESGKDKFGREAIFLACSILPLYGGAIFLDAIVFNSIEFWTEKNPLIVKRIENGNQSLVMKYQKGKKLRVDIFENNQHKDTILISKNGNGIEITDTSGKKYQTQKNGDITSVYKDNKFLFSYSQSDIDKLL